MQALIGRAPRALANGRGRAGWGGGWAGARTTAGTCLRPPRAGPRRDRPGAMEVRDGTENGEREGNRGWLCASARHTPGEPPRLSWAWPRRR